MDLTLKTFSDLACLILNETVISGVKYISPTLTVKATRRIFNKKIDKRSKRTEILFTIGTPNYAEREFIREAKMAGEPFPIKKIHIRK